MRSCAIRTWVTRSNPQEITIPIPWGHIAAKLWNPQPGWNATVDGPDLKTPPTQPPNPTNGKKVLCIHGWLDNANSFDTLIPLLPSDVTFLAVDLPGHGLSSHLPVGMVYYFTDWLFHVYRILKWMRWETGVTLMGHSLGAAISLLYASTFPDTVKSVVSLDIMAPYTLKTTDCAQILSQGMAMYLNFEADPAISLKPYTRATALERLLDFKSLNAKTAPIMLERGMRPIASQDGNDTEGEATTPTYVMNRDMRLHYKSPLYYSDEQWKIFVRKLKCPLLVILGTESNIKGGLIKEERFDEYEKLFRETLGPLFMLKEYPGTHHLHMNSPQLVAPDVTHFLSQEISSHK